MQNREMANEQEWANAENWSDSTMGLYFSKRDTRVWVPKRRRELGWTLNLARAAGAGWFLAILLAPSLVLLVVLMAVVVLSR